MIKALKTIWVELDDVRPDGWSIGLIIGGSIFGLTYLYIRPFWLWVISFLGIMFVCWAYLLGPYGKRIEEKIFSIEDVIIRRLSILLIKVMALIIAMIGGIAGLAYWA